MWGASAIKSDSAETGFLWIIYYNSHHANQLHLTSWFQTHAFALTQSLRGNKTSSYVAAAGSCDS